MSVIDKLRKRVADTTTRRDGVITVINGPPCSCGECRACEAREVLNAHDIAHAEGVATERARVVADLRAQAIELRDDLPDNVAGELSDRADYYERGEHVATEKKDT